MKLRIVVLLDPLGELAVERVERGQIERAGEELVAHGAEETLDFAFGRAVAHRCVVQEATDAGAHLDQFF